MNLWLPIIVSVLALLFLDPLRVLLPEGITMLVLSALMLATVSYGLFVFSERAEDEREVSIRAFADRWSCLVGMSLLVLSITYRLFVDGHVYPEIILILVIMITSKSVAHWYACKHL